MSEKKGHKYGKFESVKFHYKRSKYRQYVDFLNEKNLEADEYLEEFAGLIGHMSLNRLLTIYELYKKTLGIAGHIADVGVYKGSSSLLFAKLIKIFESGSLTMCHGFDWFEGTITSKKDNNLVFDGGYSSSYHDVKELVEKQGFDNILKIHKLDLRSDLPNFFEENSHLKFKLVMMDAGTYEVMKSSIPIFYDRLIPGGIMIFDQYSHELAPGESLALSEILPKISIQTIPGSWMPNAYIVK